MLKVAPKSWVISGLDAETSITVAVDPKGGLVMTGASLSPAMQAAIEAQIKAEVGWVLADQAAKAAPPAPPLAELAAAMEAAPNGN